MWFVQVQTPVRGVGEITISRSGSSWGEFWTSISYVIQHTIILALIVVSIHGIKLLLEHSLGEDDKLFGLIRIRWATDTAHIIALVRYLWSILKRFGRPK